MLFNYIFLLNNPEVFNISVEHTDGYEFIIPLSKNYEPNKALLFKQLHNTPHKFCFLFTEDLIESANTSVQELIKFLVPLILLPNYIRHRGAYIFLIQEDNFTSKLKAFKEHLMAELVKHITYDVVIDSIRKNTVIKNNRVCITDTEINNYFQEELKMVDFEKLEKRIDIAAASDKKWIIPIVNEKSLIHAISLTEQLESWFQSTRPLLSSYVGNYKKTVSKNSQLSIENNILKIKLKNSNDNIKVLRENSLWYVHEHGRLTNELHSRSNSTSGSNVVHNETNELELRFKIKELSANLESLQSNRDTILEWYKKEYEVLPKWYKRFGHIIKVITGKRTFKSLFKK